MERRANLLVGLASRLAVFVLLAVLAFALPRLLPGDPVDLVQSSDIVRSMTGAETDGLRQQIGLSGSWLEQFRDYCLAILRGDLGYSLRHAAPVTDLLRASAPWTGLLIVGAMPIYLFVGVAAGIEAGRAPFEPVDRILTTIATVLASIPPFACAIGLLLVFGVLWPVFPVGGAQPIFPSEQPFERIAEIARYAALPVLALSFHEVVRFFFLSRGEAMNLSTRAFVQNARSRGIHGWRERAHYFGRNLLPVVLARMSDSITALVGAILYVEVVFSYPGIGHLIYGAILDRDYALLQGAVLGLAALMLSLNWIMDAVVALLAERG